MTPDDDMREALADRDRDASSFKQLVGGVDALEELARGVEQRTMFQMPDRNGESRR